MKQTVSKQPVISAKNLNLIFETNDGSVHALKDIDLNVEKSDFVSFIGPSGCGKTTTLRMLAGFEDPTDGEILIGENVVNDIEPGKRGIGMVFQNHALPETLLQNESRDRCNQYININLVND